MNKVDAMPGIKDILKEVKQLSAEEQLSLLERLVAIVKRKPASPEPLSAIAGVGSEIWGSKANIDEYLEKEREW